MTTTYPELEQDLLEATAATIRQIDGMWSETFRYLAHWLGSLAEEWSAVGGGGAESLQQPGGDGSPWVPEFGICEVQATTGRTIWAARLLAADALSLVHRLPRTLDALDAGLIGVDRARMVARTTRHLSLTQVTDLEDVLFTGPDVDHPLVARMSRRRLEDLVEQACDAAEPDEAEDRVAWALAHRDVKIDTGDEPGIAEVRARVSTTDGARLDLRLRQVVGWLVKVGDTRSTAELRAVALGMLADHGRVEALWGQVQTHRAGEATQPDEAQAAIPTGPMPATVLFVHHDASTRTWSVDRARASDPLGGPITHDQAVDLVGHGNVRVTPVIDLAEDLTYTGYVAPPRLRTQLRQMNAGLCPFPWCDRPAATGDYDHQTEYPRGPTSSSNGHLLCRHHHRAKTHTTWRVTQPAPGVYLWTDPRGHHHLVTGGTTTSLD
ncbi:DUF222 domain-containing protein [Solicola sp. PLA-1-18]|uniref:HNH endonuclease signature motif containing protein n=1 Tax=Solicola sp. PLA-1-18 TaxID=3380532 RepID=UPI003B805705